jgi:hypothetical protein
MTPSSVHSVVVTIWSHGHLSVIEPPWGGVVSTTSCETKYVFFALTAVARAQLDGVARGGVVRLQLARGQHGGEARASHRAPSQLMQTM